MSEFLYKKMKHIIDRLSDVKFNPFGDGEVQFDNLYRIYGEDFIHEPESINASGYGFATVFKIPLIHYDKLNENIETFLDNIEHERNINMNLKVNRATPEIEFADSGIDMVIMIKKTETHLWGFIIDTQPNYLSYHFLLTDIYDFKNKEMNMFEDDMIIKSKKQDIFWASGDENTDQEFSMWIQQESPKHEKELIEMGVITPFE